MLAALAAAALFGISTPFAKRLVGDTSPFMLAGLLYFGSGLGLAVVRIARDRGWRRPVLRAGEWGWLVGAIVFGGVLGPLLLMVGLASTPASSASLLLNLEAVLTAVLAWVVFHENADRRVIAGMALIVAGGVLLSMPGGAAGAAGAAGGWRGPLAVAGACLAWAIDNNLTRKVSASDALFLAGIKGLIAGATNTALAFAIGARWPQLHVVVPAMLTGFFGYGLSLVLFVLALRDLGSARTGAYFSTAPFIGAAVSIALLGEATSWRFWPAAALMAVGVWLHLTERHEHEHDHDALNHTHRHVHDAHHQHEHDFPWDGVEPHTHPHHHAPLRHRHAHFPDIHHRHSHRH